jgi:hypothetical protein
LLVRPGVGRDLLVAVALTWLPLFVITLVEGRAIGGVREPFLDDLNAQIRLLVALPLLIGAEPLLHCRSHYIVRPFIDRGLVTPADRLRFEECIEHAERQRSSILMRVALALGSTALAGWIWHQAWSVRGGVWYLSANTSGEATLTVGGWWYVFVSLNVFRFALLRWYHSVAIWYHFLWQVSRLQLNLNPLHPDRAGGLGFLALSIPALGLGFLAQTIALAGRIGGRILHDGSSLDQFIPEMSVTPVLLTVVSVVPLVFFSVAITKLRLKGSVDYGGLATEYVDDFRRRWMRDPKAHDDSLLGTSDIQSLADLSNSFQVVTSIRLLPVSLPVMFGHALLLAAPFLPLALTKLPFDELIRRVAEKLI